MAFVNELVPEEDKKRIDFGSIKYPLDNYPSGIYKWTIDRDRDVFFMGTCGAWPDQPNNEFFVLYRKNEFIRIELQKGYVGSKDEGYVYTWSLRGLQIPKSQLDERDLIYKDLKDALEVYGDCHQHKGIRAIQFNF